MARVRRTVYVFFHCHDGTFLDIELLLRGVAKPAPRKTIYAVSILGGDAYPISAAEFELLLSLPSNEWVEANGADQATILELAGRGLVLSDADDDETLAEFRRRDELLAASQWNIYAALYHFMTKWRDVDFRTGLDVPEPPAELPPLTQKAIEDFVARHGKPPAAFHSVGGTSSALELPVVERTGGLYEALAARKTTRHFDRTTPIGLDHLATILYHVFGCHGYASILGDIVSVKRTSPSGGGLHPIEAYPLVANVEGIPPGVYHYSVADHALEQIDDLLAEDVFALATNFMCGQSYFGAAHVTIVLTARFYRSFWKYRKHQKAYSALLMDAAHLSQTLYLVCAELGLGAFVTAAINAHNIEERLGLDGWNEGVLAMAGCGRRGEGRSPFEPEFAPYVPRETDALATGSASAA